MEPIFSTTEWVAAEGQAIRAGMNELDLMRRAAEGLRAAYPYPGRTALVCGSGNNGGDGYCLAGLLAAEGRRVDVFALKPPRTEAARHFAALAEAAGVPIIPFTPDVRLAGYDTVVDCLLGTGAQGAPRPDVAAAIAAINASGAYVIACDVNSGLSENGLAASVAVRSHLTVALGGAKYAHVLGQAADFIGRRVTVDLGVRARAAATLFSDEDAIAMLPPRPHYAHKGSFGRALILAGSRPFSGAAKLAAMAFSALRCGGGLATLAVPESIVSATIPYTLEVIVKGLPEYEGHFVCDPQALEQVTAGQDVIALGMGMGRSDQTGAIVDWVLRHARVPLILDADAIHVLGTDRARLRLASAGVSVTPHPQEMAHLMGVGVAEVLADPVGCAQAVARETGANVLLKGNVSVAAGADGLWLVDRGSVGQASAGSGDVLAGVLAGLQGFLGSSAKVCALGAYLAGVAGEAAAAKRGVYAACARDTVEGITTALAQLSND